MYVTPWRRILFEKLILPHLVQKFPTPYGTRMNYLAVYDSCCGCNLVFYYHVVFRYFFVIGYCWYFV